MAKNTQLSSTTVSTQADATASLLNGGTINIYDGTQPADGDTAITSQNLLVVLTFGTPAFGAASGGVVTANPITGGTGVANGTASWCRCLKSDGTTVIMDGTVGTADSNLVLSSLSISVGLPVSASAFTYTVNKSTSGF